jgi:hypothetical protein
MTAALPRAMMYLAARGFGESRREWALAMEAEFAAALEDGKPFSFAAGCLMAAWRGMPATEEGRFVLVNYALALGLLIPMAALQCMCAAGFPDLFTGPAGLYDMLAADNTQGPYWISAHVAAAPSLLTLWSLLGVAHIRLAWAQVECDWPRVMSMGSLMAAATVTLAVFMGVLLLDAKPVFLEAIALVTELTTILCIARWHGRLFPSAPASKRGWQF